MRPFGTLAEAMRAKNIEHLVLIEGVAYMALEDIVDGRREGVLHLGKVIKIKSQLVYEKYQNLIPQEIYPCTFEEVRNKAQEQAQLLFQRSIQKNKKKAAEQLAAQDAL